MKIRTFDGAVMHSWEDLCEENCSISILDSSSNVMIYSELRGLQGVEICEYDIIDIRGTLMVVDFSFDEGFTLRDIRDYNYEYDDKYYEFSVYHRDKLFGYHTECKIVGNIHENKDIIKGIK